MQLIIKPTSKCNFNCNFCSAKLLNIKHSTNVPSVLKDYIKELNPSDLIITGGEPLMIPKEYYEELLSLGDWNISLTSNLGIFYKNPDYWTPLLKNDRIGVITSFQYGNDRIDGNDVYTEEQFIKVINLFEEKIGYKPNFITVISEENEDKALDHILLAKRLGIKCKLNGILPMGLSKSYYPRYKMMNLYIKIIEMGLEDYEINCSERHLGKCNFNTNLSCKDNIRACYVDFNNQLHKCFCEDLLAEGFEGEYDNSYINDKCLTCELCRLCNGCMKTRLSEKLDENHCQEMLKIKDKILEMGWST